MGVGQSSMMGIIGAVGSAGVAARMVGTEANQQIAAGQAAQQETNRLAIENKQDIFEADIQKGIAEEADLDFKEHRADLHAGHELMAEAKTPEDREYLHGEMYKAAKGMIESEGEMQKAQQAFKVLQDKIDARNFMMENNKKAIARAQRWGGLK